MAKILRNTSTPEGREFWESDKRSAEGVRDWPAWKRAGVNDPMHTCDDDDCQRSRDLAFQAQTEARIIDWLMRLGNNPIAPAIIAEAIKRGEYRRVRL